MGYFRDRDTEGRTPDRNRDLTEMLKAASDGIEEKAADPFGIKGAGSTITSVVSEYREFELWVDQCLAEAKKFIMGSYEYEVATLRDRMEKKVHETIRNICALSSGSPHADSSGGEMQHVEPCPERSDGPRAIPPD